MDMALSVAVGTQIIWLFVLGIPIACIAWTVTHEDVFREPREYCKRQSESARSMFWRKFFYLFTCEYCFSHYVAAFFLLVTRYKLLYSDWRGYLVAFFSLPFVANIYLGILGKVKLSVMKERAKIRTLQEEAEIVQLERTARRGMNLQHPAA